MSFLIDVFNWLQLKIAHFSKMEPEFSRSEPWKLCEQLRPGNLKDFQLYGVYNQPGNLFRSFKKKLL